MLQKGGHRARFTENRPDSACGLASPNRRLLSLNVTCLSDLYATAAILWSRRSMHSGEGTSSPVSPKTLYSHICSRSAPSMSVNVGVTFAVYHGRSLSTCEPSWPFRQYHRTATAPTNH